MTEPKQKLGFGAMRLPLLADRSIDMTEFTRMVDSFMERGFNYFDTAYPYHGGKSETALCEALAKRYPRESYLLADKLSVWCIHTPEELPKMIEKQLINTGAGYFDNYLVHSLTKENITHCDELGVWDFVRGLKAAGKIRHWGFSFHDTPEVLDALLDRFPDAEFVQLQINYADWDATNVQARRCYETARAHGKPVIIMEPVKGGTLAKLPDAAEAILHARDAAASMASFALRWCAALEGVYAVLSGMSSLEQVEDNTSVFAAHKPFTDADRQAVDQALAEMNKTPLVPCMGCRYCVEGCPAKILIPDLMEWWNEYLRFQNLTASKNSYVWSKGEGGAPSDCLSCGACEQICPQHLPIPSLLQQMRSVTDR